MRYGILVILILFVAGTTSAQNSRLDSMYYHKVYSDTRSGSNYINILVSNNEKKEVELIIENWIFYNYLFQEMQLDLYIEMMTNSSLKKQPLFLNDEKFKTVVNDFANNIIHCNKKISDKKFNKLYKKKFPIIKADFRVGGGTYTSEKELLFVRACINRKFIVERDSESGLFISYKYQLLDK